jgi:hypothetical protein
MLQTVVDVAAEKNSTLVMPFPVELLRFFEAAAGAATQSAKAAESSTSESNGHSPAPVATTKVPPVGRE